MCAFQNLLFPKKKNHEYPSVSNSLDLDLARRFVGSDLNPSCLQMSSTDDKSCCNTHHIASKNQKWIAVSSGCFICNGMLYRYYNACAIV